MHAKDRSVDDPQRSDGARKQTPKRPRKVSPRYLENAALHYLRRYAATVNQLRRVLTRKVDRSLKFHGGDRSEALAWVEALLEKLVRSALLNDDAYAEMKARSLRASGRSARLISQKLRHKGVPEPLVARTLAEATAEIPEEQAAWTWARRKRLGPFRASESDRKALRQRDLAALARAGFGFGVARQVIDGSLPDEEGA